MEQIADVIQYEGDNTTFVWKHPLEDFNSMTQLVVHESQEALFFRNGEALDLFGPGRHTLETQNIPKIGRFLNRTTGDQTPFHCEVYFINKTEQMAIKWGTDSKVTYIEPQYNFAISLGASGDLSLRVEDSRKLLLKLVGTESNLGRAKIIELFRGLLMTKIKTYIVQTITENHISIFEIDGKLDLFSNELKRLLIPDFSDYGVALERFWVTNVVRPDGDRQYEKFKDIYFRQYADIAEAKLRQQTEVIDAQTKAQKTVIESQARAQSRQQEGYTYQQEKGFEVMSEVARNEGTGSDLRNAAMGIGIGFGVGAPLGNAMGNIANGTMNGFMSQPGSTPIAPMEAEPSMPGMIRLKDSGDSESADDDMAAFEKKIKRLNMMRENGLLSDEELNEMKKQLLSQI